jgi:putative phosphoribosyl transferase
LADRREAIMIFRNRRDAGRYLAAKLLHYRDAPDIAVLALPRGGTPVAFEVAKTLQAPLDVFLVRKLGVPGHREFAMGAVATGEVQILNQRVVDRLRIPSELIEDAIRRERREIERQEAVYRHGRRPLELQDRTVILVDDGLATGSTMRAAVESLRQREPRWIAVAVPVGAAGTCHEFADVADEVICAASPEQFHSVGDWYEDFSQTSDEEVTKLLREADQWQGPAVNIPSYRSGDA